MVKTHKSRQRIEAEALADRLVRDYPQQVLEELQRVLEERLPRSAGRPLGTGKDDSTRLERVATLLESGDAEDMDEAIQIAAREDPGKSEKNTRKRLRRKFPVFEADRKRDRERARRKEVLAAAFEEEVEVWDL